MKSLLKTGCACIMVLTFISPLDTIPAFADSSECFQKWSTLDSYDFQYDKFMKRYMELEYSAYIRSETEYYGIALSEVRVSAVQDENENWIPYEVFYKSTYPISSEFKKHIAKVLGITEERQYVNEQNTMGTIE